MCAAPARSNDVMNVAHARLRDLAMPLLLVGGGLCGHEAHHATILRLALANTTFASSRRRSRGHLHAASLRCRVLVVLEREARHAVGRERRRTTNPIANTRTGKPASCSGE